jgi:5-methylcytosine-specific restriction protein B
VTYEDFIIGLAPDPTQGQLRFEVRPGALLSATSNAAAGPYLLVIDEVNRADLGKVLGEAIYLFEADEVGGKNAREVELPHEYNGSRVLRIPENLFVLATMNTADRSIAPVDLAIRRRFAFVTVPPDRSAVADRGLELAINAYDRLADVFVEHASDEALALMPGHAYFLAPDEPTFKRRVIFELIPLLDDYLRQGLLGSAAAELQAVRDSLADQHSLDASA